MTREPLAFGQAAFFVSKNNRKYFGKISQQGLTWGKTGGVCFVFAKSRRSR
jgi:hypothetical protein